MTTNRDQLREQTRQELEGKKTPEGRVKLDDLVTTSVVAMFFVQKLGKVSIPEIHDAVQENHGEVDQYLVEQAVEALRARGLISYARGRKKYSGHSVKMLKPRQSIWSAPPEVAHIIDLLPALVASEESEHLLATLNKSEAEGDNQQKAKRKLGYDEYYQVRVTFQTLDELLGSQPQSPHLDKLVKASPYNGIHEADTLRFWRHAGDGALVIGSDAIRGWLRTGLRTQGFADSVAGYIGVSEARIYPKRPLEQVALPVVDSGAGRGAGKGITSYEAVQPGERFTVLFRLPRRGFMGPEEFKVWLMAYAVNPIRGLSPARGGRFGKAAVVGFEVLGELKSGRAMLEAVSDDLPPEAREYYQAELVKLREQDVNLRRGQSAA